MTLRYAVIGKPITHSLSPVMQQAAFDALGLDAKYEAIEAGREDAEKVFARLRTQGYAGWNVTTPLKDVAVELVDDLTPQATAAKAVNTVRCDQGGRLVGHNTDGEGFLAAIEELWSWKPIDGPVLLLGSGPAARAIATALRANGTQRLFCWSRNAARAAAIAPLPTFEDVGRTTPRLIVSCLPPDARPPHEIGALSNDATLLFDLNYRVGQSPLATFASRQRSDGLPLLLHQGALSLTWWTGKRAPLSVMRAKLHADST